MSDQGIVQRVLIIKKNLVRCYHAPNKVVFANTTFRPNNTIVLLYTYNVREGEQKNDY